MKSKRHVLYVAPHGLGDLVMSIRAIELLVDQGFHPTVLVKSGGERDYLSYTTDLPLGDVIVIDDFRKRGKLLGAIMLLWALRKTQFEAAVSQMNVNLRQFDLLLRVLRVGRRRTSVTALRDFTTQDSTVWDRHKVDLNIDLVTTVLDLSDQVNLAATWPSRVPRSNTAPRIALAPGSGEVEAHKRWPAARYAQLAVKIIAVYPDAEIRVYGAPNEAELCAEVAALSKEAATVAKVRSVTELFDAFCEVDICVANCNGASHVAAHAGAVVVGVYGPTQAEHTGAHASSMIKISRDLECSPCYRRGYITGCGDPICLTDLPDCRVADAVFAILEAG